MWSMKLTEEMKDCALGRDIIFSLKPSTSVLAVANGLVMPVEVKAT